MFVFWLFYQVKRAHQLLHISYNYFLCGVYEEKPFKCSPQLLVLFYLVTFFYFLSFERFLTDYIYISYKRQYITFTPV